MPAMKTYELAQRYFPSTSRDSSVRRLRRWLQADSHLYDALRRAGYRSHQHYFTPRQVEVFRRIMGEYVGS